jgi:hypothetical protein
VDASKKIFVAAGILIFDFEFLIGERCLPSLDYPVVRTRGKHSMAVLPRTPIQRSSVKLGISFASVW